MDESCRVSDFILQELGYDIFYCTADLRILKVPDVEAIRKVKTRKVVGYNFFACSSSSHFSQALEARLS